ncbi:MAG TPA: hypothetical protein VK660_09480 [Xanthomonadaceae bacterium]|jgi:hypothetical protein|nr:hypothetical protein [Xanthomonadaceae bacterium]
MGTRDVSDLQHTELVFDHGPQNFGVTAAASFGKAPEVFDSEEEAMKWLRDLR